MFFWGTYDHLMSSPRWRWLRIFDTKTEVFGFQTTATYLLKQILVLHVFLVRKMSRIKPCLLRTYVNTSGKHVFNSNHQRLDRGTNQSIPCINFHYLLTKFSLLYKKKQICATIQMNNWHSSQQKYFKIRKYRKNNKSYVKWS